uniref:Metastriate ixostatin family member n=1 Tax=Rhipicephalus zambeziensis TaxID=60191 RepID=A0A224YCS6_9ACAR
MVPLESKIYVGLVVLLTVVLINQNATCATCPTKLTKCTHPNVTTCLQRPGNCQCSCTPQNWGCNYPWKWGFCSWWQRVSCDFSDSVCMCRCGA